MSGLAALDPAQIAIIVLAYVAAGFVKGTTGLGFSTTCLPILVYAVGLKQALPLVLLPSLLNNLYQMADAGHFRETARRFWPLFAAQVPGIALGLWLLTAIDEQAAAAGLGIVLAAYGLFDLLRPATVLPVGERAARAPVGFLTALVNGVTGTQVMPLVPYLLALRLDPARFVQAVNCSFTLSTLAMAAGLSTIGLLTPTAALISLFGVVPALAAAWAGGRLRRRLDPAQFRTAVIVVLIVLGLSLVVRAAA